MSEYRTITIVNPNQFFLANLTRKIEETSKRNLRVKESLDLGYWKMDETIPKKRDFLVPALPLIEEVAEKAKSTDVIEFLAKQRAGSNTSGPTYKVKVQHFNEGTVSEWIAIRKAIKELWIQNNIVSQADRVANISSILRGESLTGFEEKIEELCQEIARRNNERDSFVGGHRQRRSKCGRGNDISTPCVGNAEVVDETWHEKAKGAFI